MKTTEEIKKGLEYCGKNSGDPCRGCPYERTIGDAWTCEMTHDALAIIQQLEAQLEQVTREQDAAVRGLARYRRCIDCARYDKEVVTTNTLCDDCSFGSKWQWRGVEVE